MKKTGKTWTKGSESRKEHSFQMKRILREIRRKCEIEKMQAGYRCAKILRNHENRITRYDGDSGYPPDDFRAQF